MLKQISDMPPGTIGFEAHGDVEDDDFEDVVAPILRQEIADGREVRVLYLLGPRMEDYEGDAVKEQMKFAARHATEYARVAIVSDESWLRPAMRIVSMLVPGQVRGFRVVQLQSAKDWLAGADEPG